MADKHILHMLSPLRHVSPFDVNMALDAGFDAVLPYAGVTLEEVAGLVQDAIFSRPPQLAIKTGIFIGGRDAIAALDMAQAARRAMVPPFVASVFADPAGAFTTAAAMVAKAARLLRERHARTLDGLRVAVFGATGVVGFATGVIAARHGAHVTLVGHDGAARVGRAAAEIAARFALAVDSANGGTAAAQADVLAASDVVFCAGRAGTQILSAAQVAAAAYLLVVCDLNVVPPAGIEGLGAHDDGVAVAGRTLGIGPLAIGHIKYKTEFALFRRMIEADTPISADLADAFDVARALVG
jgi:methylene-tetrahydromethanopterin dehydrogenase